MRLPLATVISALALTTTFTVALAGTRYLRPLSVSGAGNALVAISLEPGMPAALAGVMVGDTLLEADGATLQSLRDLRLQLGNRGRRDSTTLLIGRASGRLILRAMPEKRSHRLGVTLAGSSMTDKAGAAVTLTATVQASLVEFGDGSYARVDVKNDGNAPHSFGPDSIIVIDGGGGVVTALSPQDLLALKFGGSVTSISGQTHDSMGDAVASGIMSGWAQATRETYTRSVLQNALRDALVPVGSRHGGAVFFANTKLTRPVSVRVRFAGTEHELRFGD